VHAKQAGAMLVIINRDTTPLDDIADVVIHAAISVVLPVIDDTK
jgi:NAD-dependent SIR2 family protein deacetylase